MNRIEEIKNLWKKYSLSIDDKICGDAFVRVANRHDMVAEYLESHPEIAEKWKADQSGTIQYYDVLSLAESGMFVNYKKALSEISRLEQEVERLKKKIEVLNTLSEIKYKCIKDEKEICPVIEKYEAALASANQAVGWVHLEKLEAEG